MTIEYKVKSIARQNAFSKYRSMMYGDLPMVRVVLAEVFITMFGWIPGLLGLGLRAIFYPFIFPTIGKKVVFGRNVTIRHPQKIRIGNHVIIDDNAVIDAKGEGNAGIVLGDHVYIGRNSIVYCKGGNITLGEKVNLSSNCQLFSCRELSVGAGTMIGAYSYFLSGGEYDQNDPTPYAEQSGMCTKGPTIIGSDCWLGARVTVLDGVTIGNRCVIAACALVHKPVPDHSLAAGVPARVIKSNQAG